MSTHSDRSKVELPSNSEMVHIEMYLHNKLWQDLKTVCEEAGWETDDGLPIILAIGLSTLQGYGRDPSNQETNEGFKNNTRTGDTAEQDHRL